MIEKFLRKIVIWYLEHYYGFCEEDDGLPFENESKCAGCKARMFRDFIKEL